MERILVTGAATWTGGRLVQQLERRPDVTVFAVDDGAPRVAFTSEFRRIGIDGLAFAHHLLDVAPHTVIHLQTVDRSTEDGRHRAHDEAVVGAQALFGAIGRCQDTTRVIVKSDSAIYGGSARNPSVLTEDSAGRGRSDRYQRDLSDMEQFVGDAATSDPGVAYTVLRFAPIFGATIRNPLSRYLTLPAVPTLLGFDPRMQFVHEDDALGALVHAVDHGVPGTFNVAAPGQIYLSRVLRLGRRVPQPLPGRMFDAALRGLARTDLVIPRHVSALLKNGRVMDVSAMVAELGFGPSLTCRQTVLAAYGRVPVTTAEPA